MRWYNINSSIRLPSDWISQPELNKTVVGEGVEVVSQVLTKHIILNRKRWIFLKPHLLFEPIPSASVDHGEDVVSSNLPNTTQSFLPSFNFQLQHPRWAVWMRWSLGLCSRRQGGEIIVCWIIKYEQTVPWKTGSSLQWRVELLPCFSITVPVLLYTCNKTITETSRMSYLQVQQK